MAERTKWTDLSRECFINAMVEEIDAGVFVDSGFKKASWEKIVVHLNNKYEAKKKTSDPKITYTKQQCQSFYSKIKGQWSIYDMLMKNSGFGRDPNTGGPTACDSVWKAVIAAHKEAAMYRGRNLSQYEERTYIFTGQGATGKYAKSTAFTTPDIPFKVETKRTVEDDSIDDEPQDSIDEEFSRTQSSCKKRSAFEDCGSSVDDNVLAVKKPLRPLPSKDGLKKSKSGPQDELLKVLNVIASNQDKLVSHHTAPSDLSKALALFKAEHSRDLDPAQRSKFQKYLMGNCAIFILQDEEERNESIRECLNA